MQDGLADYPGRLRSRLDSLAGSGLLWYPQMHSDSLLLFLTAALRVLRVLRGAGYRSRTMPGGCTLLLIVAGGV